MILIDKGKLIEEVRKRKYSAASIKLIEEQPEVVALPLDYVSEKFADSNFLQTYLLVLHMMELEQNDKQ